MKDNISNKLDQAGEETREQTGTLKEVSFEVAQPNSAVDPSILLEKAYGLATEQFVKQPGPYSVATNAVIGDCRSLMGLLSRLAVPFAGLQCNDSFPYGFANPISTSVYYPSNIRDLDKLPVINFVAGMLSNQGHYTEMVAHWASYGFIVVISSNFTNLTSAMHILGFLSLSKMNQDSDSPLYGKIDLSKTIVSGHSAGGQAALLVASFSNKELSIIDSDIQIVGTLPIEPGPLALGGSVNSPTLILTGMGDVIVPPFTWPNLWQLPLIEKVPAWGATAHMATHFSPVRRLQDNEYAGITTAWMLFIGKEDESAKEYFIGEDYKLAKDEQFIQGEINPLRVSRNQLAENLS